MGGQRHQLHDHLKHRGLLAVAVALALAFAAGAARAQVVLDGTLGAAGALTGPNYAIGNTLGRQVGANLFHSFSQFNLANGQSATFSGLPGTANVIGRVTGASASSIDGLLRSTIAGANLWLINPRGIAFGPHAQLDLQGSFHASTASYLRLGANGRFDAANPSASVLTVDAPAAFGFLGSPAPITLEGSQLKVPSGATLSLVGGDLTARGSAAAQVRLEAPGGRVNLASLAGPGEAALSGGVVDTASAGALGSILLANATVQTDIPSVSQLPGPITIRGGRLTLENSVLSTLQFTPGVGNDVDIALTGDFSMAGGVIRASSLGNGDAGDVSIRAAGALVTGGAVIDASAVQFLGGFVVGGGRAGQIALQASGDVTLAGGSLLSGRTFDGASPGNTRIAARDLTIDGGASINVSTFGSGDAGNVAIAVRNLTLSNGGRIAAAPQFDISSTPAQGAGGRIDVSAAGAVTIAGTGSGLFTTTTGLGPGGAITVTAHDILVSGGGRISSGSEDPFHLGLIGDAGSIDLTAAGSIRLQDGAAITTQAVTAGGGRVNLHAGEILALADSRITTSVQDGSGNGGDINIDPVFVVLDHSQILARAFAGNGGNITILTQYLIVSPLESIDQSINASSERGISGAVLVSSPNSDIGTRLAALPSSYVDPASRLREACASRAGRTGNSFTGAGRGGLPAAPGAAAFADYGFGGAQRAASLVYARHPEPSASVLLSCPG
jgi:filamentous hemagglutinin family protein